ncbi:MAG TPA: glycosyl hydrolase [Clostridiales bacterium]|jgi:xylan 1,4-beta-xylosidase|nr:glycosyl hydrolase [Clostridiales bacterium]
MHIFDLDLTSGRKPLDRYWEFCVGSCHATTALREDYRKMLTRCRKELGFRYIRFHGLFNDDMSVVIKPLFSEDIRLSFGNIDNIFDFLLSIGMKPFIELGFMPSALASGDSTVFHYKGNTSPPEDYDQWAWFIKEFINHLIDRYGLSEVRQWFFEVWNEPNLGGPGSPFGFWAADMEEYFKLYETTVKAVKQCDPCLKVGGPATSNNAWIPEFISFCKENNVPVDFISTHHYPTDVVLGYGVENSPNFVNPLDLNDPEQIRKVVGLALKGGEEFEEFKKQYSVFRAELWSHVDRGVLTQMTKRAVEESGSIPLYYTEWGSLAGLASDGPFGASFIAKTILDNQNLVEGYSFWTFSDIFEEDGQKSEEFHGGFGLMTRNGIPKAPYRAFQILHSLNGALYDDIYRNGTVDIYAVNNSEINALQILAVNHHSLQHEIKEEEIEIVLNNASKILEAEITRLDGDHADACGLWMKDGSKAYLSKSEIEVLKGLSELKREKIEMTGEKIYFNLPPMGTALITVFFE